MMQNIPIKKSIPLRYAGILYILDVPQHRKIFNNATYIICYGRKKFHEIQRKIYQRKPFFGIIGVIFLSLAYIIDSYVGFILAFCFIAMVIVLNGVYHSICPDAEK